MNVSEKRRDANRRNAQRSTGPRTEAGKAQSSQNARLHGLTALLPEVGLEVEQTRAEWLATCMAQFAPQTGWQLWLVAELAETTLRLGRIGVMEQELRAVAAARADRELWDEDRRLEAEILGARLSREPSKVVVQLRQSPHGCDWLIARWAMLARVADTAESGSGWNEEQTQLAHDLMGTPSVGRSGPIGCQIDTDGRVCRADLAPGELAREQVQALAAIRDRLDPIDERRRATVANGWSDLPSHDAVVLRRYEAATRRRLVWITAQLKHTGIDVMGQAAQRAAAVPTPPSPSPQTAEAPTECPERNEPTTASDHDETNPLFAPEIPVRMTDPAPTPARKRPDSAKAAQRERKARRKRSRNQHAR